jgi:DNA-binding transcriptional LysR family regulator
VVSRAVRLLESQLGEKLFERQKKQALLTETGKILFEKVKPLCQNFDELQSNFHHLINEPKKLSLAFSDSLSFGAIEVLEKIHARDNQMQITQQIGSCSNFIDSIENGEIDMGFFFNVPKLPASLAKSKLSDVEFVYVVKNEFRKNEKVLNSFICTTDGAKQVDEMPLFKSYRQYYPKANATFVSSSSLVRKKCALNGTGVTILPKFLVASEINSNKLAIVGKPVWLSLYVIERQTAYRNRIKNELISSIKKLV